MPTVEFHNLGSINPIWILTFLNVPTISQKQGSPFTDSTEVGALKKDRTQNEIELRD